MNVEFDFFTKFNELFSDLIQNSDVYIHYMLWGLLMLGIFGIFWGFFLRINKSIKTGELINRIIISLLAIYFFWLLIKIFEIDFTLG